MQILKPIETSINIPIDDDLLNVLMTKINNLKQENEHLKYTIRHIQEQKSCMYSVNKEPEIIDHTSCTSILRLACYCESQSRDHGQHIICKIIGTDEFETKTLAYYISEDTERPLSMMIQTLANLHKELIHEMIKVYSVYLSHKE